MGIAQWLKLSLKKRPLLTNTVIYGTFYTAAEFSQQFFNKYYAPEKPDIDYVGLMRIVATGTGVYAPSLYYWYRYLDKKFVGTGTMVVANKLVREQFFMTPILLFMFFLVNAILEGKKDIFNEEFKAKYIKAITFNELFWIPAQIINFKMVPPHMRVVYVSILSFAWINVLCFIKRQK